MTGRRIGILGGTFDPPHYGHLLAAQEAVDQLGLAQVLFVPAQQNPLKRGEPISPAEQRWAMVELAVADNPLFEASRLDLDRPPPSYTVDLLQAAEEPGGELFFLVGADILPDLRNWRSPTEILRRARLAVVNRPGFPPPDLAALEAGLPGAAARIALVSIPGVAISASDMRARVRSGRPIHYLTPPPVEAYIYAKRLYR